MATDRDAAISQFCAVTGADSHVAEHYLSGFNNDLDRAIGFYFENPPDERGAQHLGLGQDRNTGYSVQEAADDYGALGENPAHGAAPVRRQPINARGDSTIDLTRAAAPAGSGAALQAAQQAAAAGMYGGDNDDDNYVMADDEDEDAMLRRMAGQREAAIAAAAQARNNVDAMLNMTRAMAGGMAAGPGGIVASMFPGLAGPAAAAAAAGGAAGGAGGGGAGGLIPGGIGPPPPHVFTSPSGTIHISDDDDDNVGAAAAGRPGRDAGGAAGLGRRPAYGFGAGSAPAAAYAGGRAAGSGPASAPASGQLPQGAGGPANVDLTGMDAADAAVIRAMMEEDQELARMEREQAMGRAEAEGLRVDGFGVPAGGPSGAGIRHNRRRSSARSRGSGGGSGSGGNSMDGLSDGDDGYPVHGPTHHHHQSRFGGGASAAAAGGPGSLFGQQQQPQQQPEEEEDMSHLGDMGRAELEEARMLEAALLGIPYEPRLPPRGAGGGSAGSLGGGAAADPEALEQRTLRWEQDQAYEESLAADRAKAASLAAAEREAREAAAREQAAAEQAARAAREEEDRVATLLKHKAGRLPTEPAPGAPGCVTLVVRLPDGSRLSRRFSKEEDPLQAVFDYIDVQQQAASFKPDAYNLVNSYPRKVYVPNTDGTLASHGITADSALFLELHTTPPAAAAGTSAA